MDVFDDFASDFYRPFNTSYSFSGELVDTEKYDIIPKPSHYEELINRKKEEIETLERQHESDEKYYKQRKNKLIEEKETLLRDRDNRIKNKDG
jgi:hypothetical protein